MNETSVTRGQTALLLSRPIAVVQNVRASVTLPTVFIYLFLFTPASVHSMQYMRTDNVPNRKSYTPPTFVHCTHLNAVIVQVKHSILSTR